METKLLVSYAIALTYAPIVARAYVSGLPNDPRTRYVSCPNGYGVSRLPAEM
jgi:hypothetical protein